MNKLIVIDFQGIQTPNAVGRGIGRYSEDFLTELFDLPTQNIYVLLVNELYLTEHTDKLLEKFSKYSNVEVSFWRPLTHSGFINSNNFARISSEKIYTTSIASLNPDAVIVLSAFEGLHDNAIFKVLENVPTLALFYDAIPMIFRERYLNNKVKMSWYTQTVFELKKCAQILSISKTSGIDGILHLKLDEKRITSIKAGLGRDFHSLEKRSKKVIRKSDFLLSVLGEDPRKNKIGLLDAFKILTEKYQITHKLKIVYRQSRQEAEANILLLKQRQLLGRVEFLDYVSDERLHQLYNECSLFIFPSLYEGLGLPVLEAFASGAPVVCSNTSSLPEIIQDARFTFDPSSCEDMAGKINEVLKNEALLEENLRIGVNVIKDFAWINSHKTIGKVLDATLNSIGSKQLIIRPTKINFVTPLPPVTSGIADYSLEIVIALSKKLDLAVITDLAKVSDLVLNKLKKLQVNFIDISDSKSISELPGIFVYSFGNSEFHTQEYELFRTIPGVVILHDYFLSGLMWSRNSNHFKADSFYSEIYQIEGIRPFAQGNDTEAVHFAIMNNPMNRLIIENATGLVVFSKYNETLIKTSYSPNSAKGILQIPLIRSLPDAKEFVEKPQKFEQSLIVAVFGIVADTKCYKEILESWGSDKEFMKHKLIFVGEDLTSDLPILISEYKIENSVEIMGRVSREQYERYLSTVDIAIQLRKNSRGEVSGALLDALAYGLPTITNAHGSNEEIPFEALSLISNNFSTKELTSALLELIKNEQSRIDLSLAAKQHIVGSHDPDMGAKKLATYLTLACESTPQAKIKSIYTELSSPKLSKKSRLELRHSLANSVKTSTHRLKVILDLSEFFMRDLEDIPLIGCRALINKALIAWPSHMIQTCYFDPEYGEFVDSIDIAKQISGKNIDGFNRLINLHRSDILITSIQKSFRAGTVIRIPKNSDLKVYLEEYAKSFGTK